jgi:hypothetical protein
MGSRELVDRRSIHGEGGHAAQGTRPMAQSPAATSSQC